MNVEYTGRQTTVTPKLRAQAEAGVQRIQKIVGKLGSVHVILAVDKYRHIAEVTMMTKTYTFVATCEEADMEMALRDALAKIEQQAVRQRQKKTTTRRHPRTDATLLDPELVPEA